MNRVVVVDVELDRVVVVDVELAWVSPLRVSIPRQTATPKWVRWCEIEGNPNLQRGFGSVHHVVQHKQAHSKDSGERQYTQSIQICRIHSTTIYSANPSAQQCKGRTSGVHSGCTGHCCSISRSAPESKKGQRACTAERDMQ